LKIPAKGCGDVLSDAAAVPNNNSHSLIASHADAAAILGT